MLDAAAKHGRKVALVGRSMVRNMQIAARLGLLRRAGRPARRPRQGAGAAARRAGADLHRVAGRAAVARCPGWPAATTGSPDPAGRHGDPGLLDDPGQRDRGVHRDQRAGPARRDGGAPGRREGARVRPRLGRRAAVPYNAVRPSNVMPVHGEWRHLRAHAALAVRTGVPAERVVLAEDGTVVDLVDGRARSPGTSRSAGSTSTGSRSATSATTRCSDRLILGEGGFISITVAIDSTPGGRSSPADDLRARVLRRPEGAGRRGAAGETELSRTEADGITDPHRVAQAVRRVVGRWVGDTYRRRPMIVPDGPRGLSRPRRRRRRRCRTPAALVSAVRSAAVCGVAALLPSRHAPTCGNAVSTGPACPGRALAVRRSASGPAAGRARGRGGRRHRRAAGPARGRDHVGRGAGSAAAHGLAAYGTAVLALGLLVLARAGAVGRTDPVRARALRAVHGGCAVRRGRGPGRGGIAVTLTRSAAPVWGATVGGALLVPLVVLAVWQRAALRRPSARSAARRPRSGGGGESEPGGQRAPDNLGAWQDARRPVAARDPARGPHSGRRADPHASRPPAAPRAGPPAARHGAARTCSTASSTASGAASPTPGAVWAGAWAAPGRSTRRSAATAWASSAWCSRSSWPRVCGGTRAARWAGACRPPSAPCSARSGPSSRPSS